MKWFFPSWNGDVRAEKTDDGNTVITMVQPTLDEISLLETLQTVFRKKKWIKDAEVLWDAEKHKKRRTVLVNASIADVAPFLVAKLKPGKQTLTALRLKDGHVEVSESEAVDVAKLAKKAEKEGKAAASVKRPTPSCPQCHAGAVEPATEVLLSFLTEDQHDQWATERAIIVEGSYTGNRYLLAHRHSPQAKRMGKICYDIDDETVLHFHDHSVPPEEEVLAAKLILEHREDWLRHEASFFGTPRYGEVFKNPFGDGSDGIPDTIFTRQVGAFFEGVANGQSLVSAGLL